jgi:hypothetical protein
MTYNHSPRAAAAADASPFGGNPGSNMLYSPPAAQSRNGANGHTPSAAVGARNARVEVCTYRHLMHELPCQLHDSFMATGAQRDKQELT